MPCPPARCPDDLKRLWRVLPWERCSAVGPQDAASLQRRAERLLRLVSPAVRIEPGFLRAVRRALGPDAADAGTEADVWQHGALASRSPVAASLHPAASKELRKAFAGEDPASQRLVLDRLRRWRKGLAHEIWFEEIAILAPESRAYLPHPDDFNDACKFFAYLQDSPDSLPGGGRAVADWVGRVGSRLTPFGWGVDELARAVHAVKQDDKRFVVPAELDPIAIPANGRGSIRRGREHCAARLGLPGNPAICYRLRRSRVDLGMSGLSRSA